MIASALNIRSRVFDFVSLRLCSYDFPQYYRSGHFKLYRMTGLIRLTTSALVFPLGVSPIRLKVGEGEKKEKNKGPRARRLSDAVVSDTVSSRTSANSEPTSLVVSCWLVRGCIHCPALRRTARVGAVSGVRELDMRRARRFAVATSAIRSAMCDRSHPLHPHARPRAVPLSCVRATQGKDEPWKSETKRAHGTHTYSLSHTHTLWHFAKMTTCDGSPCASAHRT